MSKESTKTKSTELSEIEVLKLQLATLQAEKTAAEIRAKNDKERADRLAAELYRERHIIDMMPDFLALIDLTDGQGMNLKTCNDLCLNEGDTSSPLFQTPLHKNRTLSYLYQAGLLLPAFEADLKRALMNTKKENVADVKPAQVKERKAVETHRESVKETRKALFIRLRAEKKSDAEIMNLMSMTEKLFSNYKSTYKC